MHIVFKDFRQILRDHLEKLSTEERNNISHIALTRLEFESLRRARGPRSYDPLDRDDFVEDSGWTGYFQGHRLIRSDSAK